MHIETVTPTTFEQILPLIADHQRFHEVAPDEARNRAHFGQFLEDHSRGIQFVALDDARQAVGFATLYFTFSSLSACERCVMNDLFTVSEVRGTGVGRAMIAHCLEYAKAKGFSSIYWFATQTNERAQRLYDRLPTTRDAWYTYTLASSEF